MGGPYEVGLIKRDGPRGCISALQLMWARLLALSSCWVAEKVGCHVAA